MIVKTGDSVQKQPVTEVDRLMAVYQKEPGLHRRILQIMALLYTTESKMDFFNGLSRAQFRGLDKKLLGLSHFNFILNHLKRKQLLTSHYHCHPMLVQPLTREVLSQDPVAHDHLSLLQQGFGYQEQYEFSSFTSLRNYRVIHIAAHLNHPSVFLMTDLIRPNHCRKFLNDILSVFYRYPLDPEWVASRHPVIQLYLLCVKLSGFYSPIDASPPDINQWIGFIQHYACVEMALQHRLDHIPLFMNHLLQLTLVFGKCSDLDHGVALLPNQPHYYRYETQGALALLKGDKINAIQSYESARKQFKSLGDKSEWFRNNLHGLFYVLALLFPPVSPDDLKKVAAVIDSFKKIRTTEVIPAILGALLDLKRHHRETAALRLREAQKVIQRSPTVLPLLEVFIDWATVLLKPEKISELMPAYQKKFRRYHDVAHAIAAQFYAELIQLQNPSDPEAQYFLNDLSAEHCFRWMTLLPLQQPWEYAINELHHLLTGPVKAPGQPAAPTRRLVWLIDPATQQIEIAEQSLRKNGAWSSGKPVSLKRLYHLDPHLDYLTPYDHAALGGLRQETYGWYDHEDFFWDKRQTVHGLIGHPLVFHRENRDIPLELVKGMIELQVEKTEQGYHFALSKYSTESKVFLEQDTLNRYRVVDCSEETVAICKILSEKGMTVPFQAKEKVIDIICHARNSIHIQSDVADDDLPVITGDATPHVHLFPLQEGIKINFWIRPLSEQGAYYRAAQGQRSLIVAIPPAEGEDKANRGGRKKVVRDFARETLNRDALLQSCQTLTEGNEKTDEWIIPALEESLECLLELEEYQKNHPLVIEWPKGQTFKVKKTLSAQNLSLSIHGSPYWFEYAGEVAIDQGQVLDIKKLLELLSQSQGRFVPLAPGEFVALTEKFKRQLEDLRMLSDEDKIYHLSASGLRGLAEEAGAVKADPAWTAHLKKLAAMEKHQPVIPSTLQAELRDYQRDGFAYLSRLAHWEIGACLADDMGLGKTVQAIALLLTHAPAGPCLVVAPTSVCFVWLEELAKFSPTLAPHTLYNANDREALIDSLGQRDILICSYSLLHQAGESLIQKSWQMIILDEAQAIKNPETKRWKYATQLNSSRRIALTGTPIENHLGELWSIFRFLNPGLLGSLTFFQQRFSGPIEKYQDPARQASPEKCRIALYPASHQIRGVIRIAP